MELFHYAIKNDYDHKAKIGDEYVLCYSAKRMKADHAEVDLSSVCEASLLPRDFDEERASRSRLLGKIDLSHRSLGLVPKGTHLRIGYQKVGYICLADGRYAALCVSRIPFLIVLLLLLAALAVAAVLLIGQLGPDDPTVIQPDHPLPPVDAGLVPEGGGGEVNTPDGGGGAVSMIYQLASSISLGDGTAEIYFRNPPASDHSVALEFYIISNGEEHLVARSGLIPAGNGLYSLTLDEDAPVLSEGLYAGLYRVIYYHPISGVRANVQSDITDVLVTVKQ